MDNSGRSISPQLKATILRMVRELVKSTDGGKNPLSSFGLTPVEAEATVLHLIEELSFEQMSAVLRGVLALATEMLEHPDRLKTLKEGHNIEKWMDVWMAENAPRVTVTMGMKTLLLTLLLASAATSKSDQALIDILSPDEFAKMKLRKAQEREKAN